MRKNSCKRRDANYFCQDSAALFQRSNIPLSICSRSCLRYVALTNIFFCAIIQVCVNFFSRSVHNEASSLTSASSASNSCALLEPSSSNAVTLHSHDGCGSNNLTVSDATCSSTVAVIVPHCASERLIFDDEIKTQRPSSVLLLHAGPFLPSVRFRKESTASLCWSVLTSHRS